jgi:hypothetical protein
MAALSRVQWLPIRTPPLAEVLNDLLSLLVTDLDQFLPEVTMFPLNYSRRKCPAEILPQPFIGESVSSEFQSAYKPIWVVHGPIATDDSVESDLV